MAMQITEEERLEALVPLHEPMPESAYMTKDLRHAIRRIEVRLEIVLEKLEHLLEEAETHNNLTLLDEYGRGEESEGG